MRRVTYLILLAFFSACLMTAGCAKSPEKRGDAFLKLAEKAKNPRVKEEREKKAYLKYLEAINYHAVKGKKIPVTLKTKLLKLTLRKLNRELDRFKENPEEANIEQIELWREDFTNYLPGIQDKKLIDGYSQFLLVFANPEYMEFADVTKVLNEVVSLKIRAADAREKLASIRTKYSSTLYKEAAKIYKDARPGLRRKKSDAKENLVFAEYKVLLALKFNPKNRKAKKLLSVLRKVLVDTYSGYERFFDDVAQIDPDVDKYDIYLCIPKRRISKRAASMEVALWNLTANPINVRRDHFFLVTDRGDTIKASKATRFHKILVDTKTDTAQAVVFPLKRGQSKQLKNLLFSNGSKVSEKFFH